MLPDFAREVWQARGCAPLVLDGAVVVAAQRDLLRRAGELGFTTTDDPGLRVLADDRVMTAVALGRRWHVRLPAAARTLCLSSLVWIPAHARPGDSDTRPLGVAIGRLWLNRREASLESPALRSGWHPSEAGWRWTDGNGELDATGVSELAFDVAMTGTYSLHPSLAMRESGMESAFIASPARRRRLGRRAG
jgi:hypothetical protein